MKQSKTPFQYNPFEDLRDLLAERSVSIPVFDCEASNSGTDSHPDPEEEQRLFAEAMEDVNQIAPDKCVKEIPGGDFRDARRTDDDVQILAKLDLLIEKGVGYVVADTPEYIEGTGYLVSREVTQRLHRGAFAIQAHIDLHGLNAVGAKQVFDAFIRQSIRDGKRAVLIVHGRGRSSPKEPVLKGLVMEWLTKGPWRKWVMAFSSARHCDGGPGATYVLLRQHPVTKRYRKKGGVGTHS